MRPDYDSEKHGEVNQTNVKYVLKTEENSISQPIEESKDEIDEEMDDMQTTELDSLMLKSNDTSEIVPVVIQNHKEMDFDKQFFNEKKNQKLNKAQKRALKFAAKRGQNPDEIDLYDPSLMQKGRKRRVGGYEKQEFKKGNNSNKITHFSNLEID